MIDDNSGNAGGAKGHRTNSLVERAAKKIVADKAPSPTESEAAKALPSPLEETPASSILELATAGQGDGSFERATRRAIPDQQDWPDGAAGTSSREQKRTSKTVDIDVGSLASRNLLTPQSKRNRTVEEMRLIKRMVLSRRRADRGMLNNTIIVTSALPEEGKTTIAINLAMSIAAEEDLRVLLVDADFVKPRALRQLGISEEKGLIDVIQDPKLNISDVMLRTNIDKLSLIPSGRVHDRCTELLASARMRDIVAELSSRYDDRILIFDSPPLLATTEAVMLTSHMGQVVFVVQAGRTRRQLVDSALELIEDRDRVGLVLNRATPRLGGTDFGSYYGYGYYHSKGEAEA